MDIEQLKQTGMIIGTVIGTMWAGITAGRKVAKKEPAEGEARVLAASIVPQSEMRELTSAVLAMTPVLREVCHHLGRVNDRLHEDELVRAAVAKIREEGRP